MSALARSPLAHRPPVRAEDGAASLAEWPFLTKVILRVDHATGAESVERIFGVSLPAAACTAAAKDDRSALWLGPDEWMLIAPDGEGPGLVAGLGEALGAVHHQAVEVSDYHTVITVSGPRARDLLAKLVTVDLHPRAFPAGSVAGTLAGAATITLWLRDDSPTAGPVFDVIVRASMADYLWCLLAEAGREYGVPPQTPVAGERLRA